MQFRLVHPEARRRAIEAVQNANEGMVVKIVEPNRTTDQNSHFHGICSDLAKSGIEWAGKKRSAAQWKVLLVSAHAVATNEQAEIVPGLEGEFLNIRESTALMSKKRGSSLIEYSIAWCTERGVKLEH